jgi:cytosine/adenosine deaminase-related metal-dependent hydrolase
VARLAAAGVPVLAGTDTPNPGTVHGASLHRELELLVGAGLTPQLALQAATSVPARVFGLIDRGVIEPGRRAPCDRSAFVGSAAEDEQFDALHAQVEKVMAAAREFWPDAGQLPDAG